MLTKHKRFALRSLAIGVIASSIVAGIYTKFVRQANARIEAVTRTAEAKAKTAAKIPKDVVSDQPSSGHLVDSEGNPVIIDSGVTQAQDEADECRDNHVFFSVLTFVIFAMPLIWYFLLDRLAEISDAVSCRSKSN